MTLIPPPGSTNAELQELLKSLGLDGVTSRPEAITPETATNWLTYNRENRTEIANQRALLARDMSNGNYLFTGQPIIFGESGRLLNGQHTLGAIIDSGVAIVCLVVRGIPNEDAVMGVLDSGKKRTLAHALQIAGEPEAARLAGSISMAWRYERNHNLDNLHPATPTASPTLRTTARCDRPSPSSTPSTGRSRSTRPPRPPCSSSTRASTPPRPRRLAEAGDGAGLYKGDPILALRRYIMQIVQRRDKPQPEHWFRVYVKATNPWRDGRSVQILAVKPSENPELWEGWDA